MNTLPIVGARHRPPADIILNGLPKGTPLLLRRDPDNPYDSNAIEVVLPAGWQANVPTDDFVVIMGNISVSSESPPPDDTPFMLGFIPKGLAEVLAPKMDENPGEVNCLLDFDATGKPCVGMPDELNEEEDEEEEEEEISPVSADSNEPNAL